MPNDLTDQFKHLLRVREAEEIRKLSVGEAARICTAFVMLDHARDQVLRGSNVAIDINRHRQYIAVEPVIHVDRVTAEQFMQMLTSCEAA